MLFQKQQQQRTATITFALRWYARHTQVFPYYFRFLSAFSSKQFFAPACEWMSVVYLCYICRIHFKCNSLLELRHKFEMRECEFFVGKICSIWLWKGTGPTEMNIILYAKLLGMGVCGVAHSNSLRIRDARCLYCSVFRSHSPARSLIFSHSKMSAECNNMFQHLSLCIFHLQDEFEYTVACETTFRTTLFPSNNKDANNNTHPNSIYSK